VVTHLRTKKIGDRPLQEVESIKLFSMNSFIRILQGKARRLCVI